MDRVTFEPDNTVVPDESSGVPHSPESTCVNTRKTEVHLPGGTECRGLVAAVARDLANSECALSARNARAGTALGPYHLEEQVGEGAMGAVYRALDTRLGRRVAIKMLFSSEPGRLLAEARAAAAVEHPNVVAIHDVGNVGGTAYVAMELIEGDTLRSVLQRGPLPIARASELAIELTQGLAAAHARGVIHRDLKPANLMVTRDGCLKILDFGVAARPASEKDSVLPGTVLGTAGYMAPEQARGEATDARTDLFAVGAILFEMIAGRRVFDGDAYEERVAAILNHVPDVRQIGPLAPIVERCLAKDPRHRFHSAADLAWVLRTEATRHALAALPRPPRARWPHRCATRDPARSRRSAVEGEPAE